ncbi:MAG: hypothetical protein FWH10_00740 [Oscillospiraceae bacterium]|nr:hypothetical protein [Oscillospiraceae bacterium]
MHNQNHEEILMKKEKRKKILKIIVLSVTGVFLLSFLTIFILSAVQNYINDRETAKIEEENIWAGPFPEANYGFNIFDDAAYLELDRNIRFNDGGTVTVMTEENKSSYAPELQFMYDAINLIINGDYTEYNKIFTEDYIAAAGDNLPERFTMQQLFEIELEYLGNTGHAGHNHAGQVNPASRLDIDIQLTYKIRNNNGTFRNDLDFDASYSRAVVYMLVAEPDGSDIKVDKILTQRQYESGRF